MEFTKLISERYSVRKYKPEKLQKEVSPVVGWAVFGGVFALAILLGFLICL